MVKSCSCPRCKRSDTLVRLPPNFKCADIICDFCGKGPVEHSEIARNGRKAGSSEKSSPDADQSHPTSEHNASAAALPACGAPGGQPS